MEARCDQQAYSVRAGHVMSTKARSRAIKKLERWPAVINRLPKLRGVMISKKFEIFVYGVKIPWPTVYTTCLGHLLSPKHVRSVR